MFVIVQSFLQAGYIMVSSTTIVVRSCPHAKWEKRESHIYCGWGKQKFSPYRANCVIDRIVLFYRVKISDSCVSLSQIYIFASVREGFICCPKVNFPWYFFLFIALEIVKKL